MSDDFQLTPGPDEDPHEEDLDALCAQAAEELERRRRLVARPQEHRAWRQGVVQGRARARQRALPFGGQAHTACEEVMSHAAGPVKDRPPTPTAPGSPRDDGNPAGPERTSEEPAHA